MRWLASLCVLSFGLGCGGAESTPLIDAGNNNNGGDSSSGNDGSTMMTSGDAAPALDGGSVTPYACGPMLQCNPNQLCCVEPGMNGGTSTYSCAATCAMNQTALKCTKTADCAMGTVCCVSLNMNQATSQCQLSCNPNQAQLCDPKAPMSQAGCPMNQPCSSANIGDWKLPNTFGTCGGKGN